MLLFIVFLVPLAMMVLGVGGVFATCSMPFTERGYRKLIALPMAVVTWALLYFGHMFWMYLVVAMPT